MIQGEADSRSDVFTHMHNAGLCAGLGFFNSLTLRKYMKFILGIKIGATQVFDPSGEVMPVTLIEAGPMVVIQKKTKEKDGYEAVQFGFGKKNEKNISKAGRMHFKNLGNFRYVKEYRPKEAGAKLPDVGDKTDVSEFKEGDIVKVSGVSKGKGFQGVMKRHGFHGHNATHGTKHANRQPGTIGGGLRTRVPLGMRMAGKMGGERVTITRLKVIKVDAEHNVLAVKGAVPGIPGGLVEVRGE